MACCSFFQRIEYHQNPSEYEYHFAMAHTETENMDVEVSLLLLTFNQADYAASAAKSCLAQRTSKPIEIIFSDDSSSDETFSILEAIAANYRGPHRVRIRRNSNNLGIGSHYNAAIAQCSGELIVTAAGDDLSMEDRVEKLYMAWIQSGKSTDLITSNLVRMDREGQTHSVIEVSDLARWTRPEQWFKKRPYVVGAAHAFTKRMHTHFGDFIDGIVYEDQIMALRATLAGGCVTVNEPLVYYRDGGASQQKATAISGPRYLKWSFQHFSRQCAQYEQIRRDLKTSRCLNLWSQKLGKHLAGARLALELHAKSSFRDRLRLTIAAKDVGCFFRFKHFIYMSWPEFAALMQRIQLTFMNPGRRPG